MTQIDKGRTFRSLHEARSAFIIPNPWDIGTAKLLASLGFQALATTSAGFAFSRGLPDGAVGFEEMIHHCREMAAATDLPVSADLGSLAAVLERAGRPDSEDRSTAAEFGRGLVQAAATLPRPEPIPLIATGLFTTVPARQPGDPTGGHERPAIVEPGERVESVEAVPVVPLDPSESVEPLRSHARRRTKSETTRRFTPRALQRTGGSRPRP